MKESLKKKLISIFDWDRNKKIDWYEVFLPIPDINRNKNTSAPLAIETNSRERSKLHNIPNSFGEFLVVPPKLEKTLALIKKPMVIKT